MNRAAIWDVVMLQKIINDGEDITTITPVGHMVAIGAARRGQHSTGILVHARLRDAVVDARHSARMTEAALQVRSGSTGTSSTRQIFGLHLPSSIGHEADETDKITQGVEER